MPNDAKIPAILDMPIEKKGVQRLLRKLNYVAKFFPNV